MKIAFFTDLHLGKHRVPCNIMLENLQHYLYPRLTDDIDLLVFGGDYFDTLISMDMDTSLTSLQIKSELKRLARKHKFLIRGIRGTLLHDRTQTAHLDFDDEPTVLHGVTQTRFIDTLSIETIPALGISLLYIPDDLPDGVMPLIKTMLADHQLDKVDIVVHHGFCEHLLPPVVRHRTNVFSAAEYAEICHGPVLNGHVHEPSVFEQIVNGGSFERLAHGEEEPKGWYLVDYDPQSNHATFEFIENKGALPFVTFRLSVDEDIEEFRKFAERVMEDMQDHRPAYLRAFVPNVHIRDAVVAQSREWTKPLVLDTESCSFSKDSDNSDGTILSRMQFPVINRESIHTIVAEHLADKGSPVAPDNIKKALVQIGALE